MLRNVYDMYEDPEEEHNLWADRQDVVKLLEELLEKYKQEGRSAP